MLIIVEYCRYGNLQSYVTNARNRFVNQVDSNGNLIQLRQDNGAELVPPEDDGYFVVGAQSSFGAASTIIRVRNRNNSDESVIKTLKENENDSTSISSEEVNNTTPFDEERKRGEFINHQVLIEMASDQTARETFIEFSSETAGIHQEEIELNSLDDEQQQQQPDWSMKYEAEVKDMEANALNPVSTRDLICWSFQIARGMDFLASKKVKIIFKHEQIMDYVISSIISGSTWRFGSPQRPFSRRWSRQSGRFRFGSTTLSRRKLHETKPSIYLYKKAKIHKKLFK